VNQNVNGAVTVVSRGTFVGARPVHTAVVAVPPGAMAHAEIVGTAPPVAPERVSVMGRLAPAGRVVVPPARMAERVVVVRNTPPPAPVSFAAKRDALVQNQGRPLDPATANSLRRNAQPPAPPMRSDPALYRPQPREPLPPRQVEAPRSEPRQETRQDARTERKESKGQRKEEKKEEKKQR